MVIDIFLGTEKDQLRWTAMAWTVLDVGSFVLFVAPADVLLTWQVRHDSGCWA